MSQLIELPREMNQLGLFFSVIYLLSSIGWECVGFFLFLTLFGLHIINLDSCAIFHSFSIELIFCFFHSSQCCVLSTYAGSKWRTFHELRFVVPIKSIVLWYCFWQPKPFYFCFSFARWTKRNQIRHMGANWVSTRRSKSCYGKEKLELFVL